jgi:hypothetical protein
MRRFLSILLVVSVVACERLSPTDLTAHTAPPPPNLSGNWSGTISSFAAGNGTISFTLMQMCLVLDPPGSGCQVFLDGTWSASFANPASNESGTLSGGVADSTVSVDLMPSASGPCPLIVTAMLSDSTSFRGTYTFFRTANPSCTADNGTVTAIKQSGSLE